MLYVGFNFLKASKNFNLFVLFLSFSCLLGGSSSFAEPTHFLGLPDDSIRGIKGYLDLSSELALEQVNQQENNRLIPIEELLAMAPEDAKPFSCKSALECKNFCRLPSSRKVELSFSKNLDSFFKDRNCHLFIEELQLRVQDSFNIDLSPFIRLKKANLGTDVRSNRSVHLTLSGLPPSLEELRSYYVFSRDIFDAISRSRVKVLDFRFGVIYPEDIKKLPNSLEKLDLSSNESSECFKDSDGMALADFSPLKSLKILKLSSQYFWLSRTTLGNLPPSLEELDISFHGEVHDLQALEGLKHLRILNASHCGLSSNGIKNLPHSLEELDLNYNEWIRSLENIQHLVHLKKLGVRKCDLNSEQMNNLLASLESLDLSEVKGMTDYQSLSRLTQLKELILVVSDLDHYKIRDFPASLETLFINGNRKISNLDGIQHLTRLKYLNAFACNLKADGITKLPPSLEKIILGENGNLVDLGGLSNLVQLKYLSADYCRLTPEGIQNLPASLVEMRLGDNPRLRGYLRGAGR